MVKNQPFSNPFRISDVDDSTIYDVCQYSDVILTAFVVKMSSQSVNEQHIVIKFYPLPGPEIRIPKFRNICMLSMGTLVDRIMLF